MGKNVYCGACKTGVEFATLGRAAAGAVHLSDKSWTTVLQNIRVLVLQNIGFV